MLVLSRRLFSPPLEVAKIFRRMTWGQAFAIITERLILVSPEGQEEAESIGKMEKIAFALRRRPRQNQFMQTDWNKLHDLALAEVEATLEALPEQLRERARQLPVTFERQPNAGLQADGIEVDTLGLFTGSEFADAGAEVLPSQIILFLENLWDFAEGDEEVFCDEVHTTFLHELGHYFGLDEDDLTARGLE